MKHTDSISPFAYFDVQVSMNASAENVIVVPLSSSTWNTLHTSGYGDPLAKTSAQAGNPGM